MTGNGGFKSFLSKGYVSLGEGETTPQPVNILRDTGAAV